MSCTFNSAYSGVGRLRVPLKTLLKALMPQCLYTFRSERDLFRRLQTDLLVRRLLDLRPSGDVFDHSAFTHSRDRLAEHGITQ